MSHPPPDRPPLPFLPGPIRRLAERVQRSPLGARLARGTFWSLTGTLVSRGLTLVAMAIAAGLLGSSRFGEFAIVQSTMLMFAVFAGFSFGLTATKHAAELRQRDAARAGRILGLSRLSGLLAALAVAAAAWALAPWLARAALDKPDLGDLLRLGTVLLFFTSLIGIQAGALAGFEAFSTIARVNVWTGLLSFPLLVGGCVLYGLPGLVLGAGLAAAATWGVTGAALRAVARRAGVPLGLAGCLREWRVLRDFGFPALLATLSGPLVNWICFAMLFRQVGGKAQAGIFLAALYWKNMVGVVPQSIGAAAFPVMSELHGRGDAGGFRKVLGYNLLLNACVAVGAATIISLLSGPIMRSYGADFAAGDWTLVVLTASGAIAAVGFALSRAIISAGMLWPLFAMTVFWAVILIGCTQLLIPAHQAFGLAIAYVIADGAFAGVRGIFAGRRLRGEVVSSR